jgi:hypothetical protein
VTSTSWLGSAVLATACVSAAVGCGSNKDIEVDCEQGAGCVEVPEDATVDVVQPAPGGPTVSLEADVRNFKLRPPGACGGAQNCGHLSFTVEGCPAAQVETHGRRTVLDLSGCGAGEHRIVVLLHNDRHAVVFHGGRPIGTVSIAVVDAEHRGNNGKGNGKNKGRNDCDCDCNCCS